MKKIRNIIACGAAAVALLATGLTSCTGDFDSINTSKDKPTPEDVDRDNAWAAFIQTMQRNVFAEGANAYQLADNLLGDSYAGYFGQAQDWDSGNNSTCYSFPSSKWKDEPYMQAYDHVMSSWNILRQKVDSASVVFALGEVVKVEAMHRATDIYGPLPYTAFGKMSSGLPYDSQETIYRTFIDELDHALAILKTAYEADASAKPISDFDVVFDSDLEKWIRFANSLKLRLAMRARFAAPGDAQTWAEEAVNFKFGAFTIGVMTDNTHTAQLQTRTGIGFSYKHPLEYLWGEYNECRMGSTMESYLTGYSDPRLEKYFSPAANDGKYHGIPSGIVSNPKDYQTLASCPLVGFTSPLTWMCAAEVYFLRAEGATLSWNMGGTAESLYNEGIRMSFNQWGASDADKYLADSKSTPAKYAGIGQIGSSNSPSDVTIKWANDGRELERIMVQKWIALYPNGQEAWSEIRRTGYPVVYPSQTNRSGGILPSGATIRRVPLPQKEYDGNAEQVSKAIADYLGGSDNCARKLWWDAK